jgi:hypothetical protein
MPGGLLAELAGERSNHKMTMSLNSTIITLDDIVRGSRESFRAPRTQISPNE